MYIDIVGGGAIGMLYGGRLAEAGADVTIWTRTREQALLLKERGIRLINRVGSDESLIPVHSNWIGQAALNERTSLADSDVNAGDTVQGRILLLTVKQTAITDELLRQMKEITTRSGAGTAAVICLQNGIGHIERVSEALQDCRIYAAVTSEGARKFDGRTVQHTGLGELWLGQLGESESNSDKKYEYGQKMLVSFLQKAGIAVFLSKEMKNRIYNKLLINAVINPLTALYNVRNGELPSCSIRYRLMQELYAEAEAVLLADGMKPLADGFDRVLEVCRLTDGNISSMLSDVRAEHVTEIESINGGIARLADQLGLHAPLNRSITTVIESLHPKRN